MFGPLLLFYAYILCQLFLANHGEGTCSRSQKKIIMADPRVKQIKIKTGVVKRLTKEKVSYEKEAVKIEEKVEQMKADKKDEYEIKKMIEVLQESKMMIPDTLKRLNNAYADLDTLLTKEEDLSETEEYKAGKTALEEAKAVMPSS